MSADSGHRENRLPSGLSGERLFAALLRSSAEGVVLSRLEDGVIIETSEVLLELTGYSREELVGNSMAELKIIDPATREDRDRTLREIRGGGSVRDVEVDLHSKQGDVRHIVFSSEVLRDEEAGQAFVLTFLHDVTEQKRREEELRRTRQRFLSVFESSPVPTAITRLSDGLIILANPACLEILGWEADEFVGRTISEVSFWAHPERRQPMIDELRARGRVRDYETEIRTKAGEIRDVRGSIELLELEGEQCLVGLFYDITERRHAEEALRESEERHRLLAENATDMISRHDPDGTILYVSPACGRLFGYAPEEMIGQPGIDFLHPEDRDDPGVRVAYQLLTTARTQTITFRHKRKDGTYVWVESNLRGVRDAQTGEVVEFHATTRDVSERVRAADELRAAKEAAETANEAKSRFLSHMSHEFRTPLAAILGFAELLARSGAIATEKDRKYLDQIAEGGQHLLQLVNELLEISRIEAGKMALVIEPIRVGGVVEEVLTLAAPLAAEREIRLEDPDVASSDPFVRADALRLKQVLLNLVSNAIKYNRPGGSVSIDATETPGKLRISVRDTGEGIPPEKLEKLFAPFERLGAEARAVEGSGLGLVVAKGLVEAMSGSLTVASEVGTGTTFAVELPLETGSIRDDDVVAPERPAAVRALTRGGVLYIEDNRVNLELVASILTEMRPGLELRTATEGATGASLAEQQPPDLLLLDLNLPDMSGEDVLRRLRGQTKTADIPVLILSADSTSRNVTRLLQTGADAYLTKPLDVPKFLDIVDRLLATQ